MDPAWVSIGIATATMIVSGLASYFGTKIALTRVEERHSSLKEQVTELKGDCESHALYLQDHGTRIRVLEDRDLRRQPMDYAR